MFYHEHLFSSFKNVKQIKGISNYKTGTCVCRKNAGGENGPL